MDATKQLKESNKRRKWSNEGDTEVAAVNNDENSILVAMELVIDSLNTADDIQEHAVAKKNSTRVRRDWRVSMEENAE